MKTSRVLLLLLASLGTGGAYLTQVSSPPPIVVEKPQKISPLEIARRATFAIVLPKHGVKGSAVLVGRKRLDNGKYRYTALTAHHVIDKTAKEFLKNKQLADHRLYAVFQPHFHGQPYRIRLKLDDFQWLAPFEDWAAFTFDMTYKMDCAPVATMREFKAIKAFEKIYAVGCGGMYDGPHCREGVIGATHNEYDHLRYQKQLESPSWNRHPEKFFRPYVNIWYGDSGGGIFSKDGKLIGIINGWGLMRDWNAGPVSHSTIAFKAHIIKRLVSINKNFFLIED